MVTTRDITPADFKAKRLLANHKQATLAAAIGCSEKTVRNFETERTDAMYSVMWESLARELKLKPARADA